MCRYVYIYYINHKTIKYNLLYTYFYVGIPISKEMYKST